MIASVMPPPAASTATSSTRSNALGSPASAVAAWRWSSTCGSLPTAAPIRSRSSPPSTPGSPRTAIALNPAPRRESSCARACVTKTDDWRSCWAGQATGNAGEPECGGAGRTHDAHAVADIKATGADKARVEHDFAGPGRCVPTGEPVWRQRGAGPTVAVRGRVAAGRQRSAVAPDHGQREGDVAYRGAHAGDLGDPAPRGRRQQRRPPDVDLVDVLALTEPHGRIRADDGVGRGKAARSGVSERGRHDLRGGGHDRHRQRDHQERAYERAGARAQRARAEPEHATPRD
jgi:hypothetical protein